MDGTPAFRCWILYEMDMMWLSEYVGRVTVCDWIAVGAARDSVTA